METKPTPLPSEIEAVILRLLIAAARESYGLDLVRRSDGELKRGTVYVTLGRMEEKGFVESRLDPTPDARLTGARRLYRITGLGQRALAARELANAHLAGGFMR